MLIPSSFLTDLLTTERLFRSESNHSFEPLCPIIPLSPALHWSFEHARKISPAVLALQDETDRQAEEIEALANTTGGCSFAYLKELMAGALMDWMEHRLRQPRWTGNASRGSTAQSNFFAIWQNRKFQVLELVFQVFASYLDARRTLKTASN